MGDTMKILMITEASMKISGGLEKVLEIFINHFVNNNHRVDILNIVSKQYRVKQEEWVAPYNKIGSKTVELPIDVPERSPVFFYFIDNFLNKLKEKDQIIGKLQQMIFSNGDYDIVLVVSSSLSLFRIKSIKKGLRTNVSRAKIVLWDHGSLSNFTVGKTIKKRISNLLARITLKKQLPHADAALAISGWAERQIKGYAPALDVRLAYNPVFSGVHKLIKNSNPPLFAYVGRLDDYPKNISFLLRALSKIKQEDWRLRVVGDGPDAKALKAEAVHLGISSRVEWKGYRDEPFEAFPEATCLLLTSRFEGFPLTLVEAIERGLPVIASDCPSGPSEIVLQGQNGYLFEPGNEEQFVGFLKKAINGSLKFLTRDKIAKTVYKFEKGKVLDSIEKNLVQIAGKPFR